MTDKPKQTREDVLNKKVELLIKELDKTLKVGEPLTVLKTVKTLTVLASKYTYEATKLATKKQNATWAEVGKSLEISKQAAHEKFKLAHLKYKAKEQGLHHKVTAAKEQVVTKLNSKKD